MCNNFCFQFFFCLLSFFAAAATTAAALALYFNLSCLWLEYAIALGSDESENKNLLQWRETKKRDIQVA